MISILASLFLEHTVYIIRTPLHDCDTLCARSR